MGNITASYKADFAAFKPAISDHLTLGFSVTIASAIYSESLSFSSPFSGLPSGPRFYVDPLEGPSVITSPFLYFSI